MEGTIVKLKLTETDLMVRGWVGGNQINEVCPSCGHHTPVQTEKLLNEEIITCEGCGASIQIAIQKN